MSWACHLFKCSATTFNPDSKSPHEIWHGSPPRRHWLSFFKPGYYKAKRTNKSQPNAQECFYLGSGRNHARDSVRVLTKNNSVITTRNVTWQHSLPPSDLTLTYLKKRNAVLPSVKSKIVPSLLRGGRAITTKTRAMSASRSKLRG